MFVIFAKEANEAVVFARGPSAWFHVIRWDTSQDKFEPGAWIRGCIYPERCDLSPDGQLLLYFVHQGRRSKTSYTCAWTGISRSPWLNALGLWPWGGTWGGGGHFEGNRKVVLAAGCEWQTHPDHIPQGLEIGFGSVKRQASSGEVKGADWSGRDQRGRLIVAANGQLCWQRENQTSRVLADFNGNKPEPKEAPRWAVGPLLDKRGKNVDGRFVRHQRKDT